MSISRLSAPHSFGASTDAVPRQARDYAYTVGIGLAAVVTMYALPGTQPSTELIYAPMALALIVGLLLTVRLAPNRLGSALVLLPAMAVDARFGLAALPALAYAAVLTFRLTLPSARPGEPA